MTLTLAHGVETPKLAERADAEGQISVRDLAVRHGSNPVVFSGVSFHIERGATVALIGANGAGKSTLLKCCLGLMPPANGEVLMSGQPLGGLRTGALRRLRGTIGFVAQKHNLVARLSVLSNVLHGMLAAHPGPGSWLHALASDARRHRAMEALERVGLADLALKRADQLSGGQSQRVAIARALVGGPRFIFADEPAASLDPAAGEEVMQVFVRVARDTRTTLVFTTHNLDHALRHSERVLGLYERRLALDAPARGLEIGGLRDLYN
jgi:phosphonate transport system ATP-binding protein